MKLLDSHGVKRGIRVLTIFLLGQGLTQILSLTTGLLLLRWLSIEDYAKFTLAFGFQVVMTSLSDVGISGAIVNLVGHQGPDKDLVGNYIKATGWLKSRIFMMMCPLGAIAFWYFAGKQSWGTSEQIILYGAMMTSIFFQVSAACYTAPLLIHQRLTTMYRIAALTSVIRLGTAGVLYATIGLGAKAIYVITAGCAMVNAGLLRNASLPLFTPQLGVKRETAQRLIQYVSPLAPGIIFFAFQGQITLLLISLVGSARQIAEVGALGRLGLLFGTLSSFSGLVVAPYFARQSKERVPQLYLFVLSAAATFCAALVFSAFLWPEPLLWLLGSNYSHMRREVPWSMVGSSLALLGGLMYAINLARRWAFWWASILTISAVISLQAAFLWRFQIDSALQAAIFASVTNGAMMLVQWIVAAVGLWRDKDRRGSSRAGKHSTVQ